MRNWYALAGWLDKGKAHQFGSANNEKVPTKAKMESLVMVTSLPSGTGICPALPWTKKWLYQLGTPALVPLFVKSWDASNHNLLVWNVLVWLFKAVKRQEG